MTGLNRTVRHRRILISCFFMVFVFPYRFQLSAPISQISCQPGGIVVRHSFKMGWHIFVRIPNSDGILNVRISVRFLIANPSLAGHLPTYGREHRLRLALPGEQVVNRGL
jgi:hypothetical protein